MTHLREVAGTKRRATIAMALVAVPFVADLPAANGTGRIFNLTMLVWCGVFMAWFRAHPPGAATARELGEAELVEEADLRTIRVEPATTRRPVLDPVERARLRFRVRDDEPASEPVDERRS